MNSYGSVIQNLFLNERNTTDSGKKEMQITFKVDVAEF